MSSLGTEVFGQKKGRGGWVGIVSPWFRSGGKENVAVSVWAGWCGVIIVVVFAVSQGN